MKKLLNFSTHPGDPEMFGDDWTEIAAFLNKWQFDGFELYPVGNYPFNTIPKRLIQGMHLRFFIFLREIWQGDEMELLLLFENLWWPGSYQLTNHREYDFLRERVNYDRCGIVLDTGHLFNSVGGFDKEEEAIDYLLQKVKRFGTMRKEIRTVHLTSSLSGSYIKQSKKENVTVPPGEVFSVLLGQEPERKSWKTIILPVTAITGSIVALCADIIAQLPDHATVLPLNAVTALIGSPVIIWFILSKQKHQRSFI